MLSRKPFFDFLLLADLIYGPILAVFLRLRGVKVTHFTTTHFSNLPFSLVFRLLGGRLIFTVHRFDLDSYDPVRRHLLSLYEKLVFLISDRVVILSDNKRVPADKKVVIPMAGYKQQVTEPKVIAQYYMFFGRIDDYKGLDDIFRLAQELPHLKFVVAGNGYSPVIADLQLLDNVTVFNRFIDDAELAGLFEGARLVLLPYKSISQSAVQILSYSYGTPVICYDVGNLKKFILDGVTGYLVGAGDFDRFRQAVNAFDLKVMPVLSKNCIAYFNANFSDKVLYDQYRDFYSKMLVRFAQ